MNPLRNLLCETGSEGCRGQEASLRRGPNHFAPQGVGYAHKTVWGDGRVVGGHMSGGPKAPRIYETKAKATPADMKKLVTLVAAAMAKPQPTLKSPDQKVAGYNTVMLQISDSKSIAIYGTWSAKFESKEIQAIWEMVGKYKVGAW